MKWEYQSFDKRLTDIELNDLGKEGWELISHSAVFAPYIYGVVQYYVFKRPIS